MKKNIFLLVTLFAICSALPAYAETPAPTLQQNQLTDNTNSSGSAVLNTFISGFDWISNGLVFNTPSLLNNPITLSDGTELSGLSQYRNIFYDIATPIFVVIVSFIAISHITHDNPEQLKQFVKRLFVAIGLFIITPAILAYSIEAINLLDNLLNIQNAFNLSTFIANYLNSGDLFKILMLLIPYNPASIFTLLSPDTLAQAFPTAIMEILLFLITIGFFLISFIYIIFQAIIRFIALLFLSVIFPIVLPFALSERTQHITNTYFKIWFTFLIQQPAFVLGFAIISAIFGSLLKAHGGNIGTLFLFSGALLFLGGVNVFIAKIFGDGWSLLTTNTQSGKVNTVITSFHTNTLQKVKHGFITNNATGIRSYTGKLLRGSIENLKNTANHEEDQRKWTDKKEKQPYPFLKKGEEKGNKPHADSTGI